MQLDFPLRSFPLVLSNTRWRIYNLFTAKRLRFWNLWEKWLQINSGDLWFAIWLYLFESQKLISDVGKNETFFTNVPLLYLLKISESRRFSDVLREYSSEILAENGLPVSFMSHIQPLIRGIRNFSEPEKFQSSSFGSATYTQKFNIEV